MSRKTQEKKSFILSLREKGRVNENFLNTVSDLTLEELIVLKLEMSSKMMRGKLYNFPIWYTMPSICRDACMLFARTCCNTKSDMASVTDYSMNTLMNYYRNTIKIINTVGICISIYKYFN